MKIKHERENRLKSDSIQKNPKVTVIVVLIFAIIVFLFSNCRTTEFKIHSVKLERREAEYLYFRLISDIDLLDKRECQGEHCYVRFEFYPIDKYNPQRRVKIGGWPEKLKIYPWNESGVKEQFDVRNGGATFGISLRPKRYVVSSEDFLFVGSKSGVCLNTDSESL